MDKQTRINQRHTFWQTHIQQWQVSTLSQAAYCREHDLSAHHFSYYKRTLSGASAARPAQTGFVNVQVAQTPAYDDALSVQLSNGVRICGVQAHHLSLVSALVEVLS